MSEWFREYWVYALIFAAVCILAVVVFFFAVRASASHNKAFKEQEAHLKELSELKNKYRNFTGEMLEGFPEEEILKGVNVIYQSRITKAENPEQEFLSFNEDVQKLYVLQIFVEDGGVKQFYSQSDDLLRKRLLPALRMIGLESFAEAFDEVSKMFDKDDETVSYDIKKAEKLDEFINEQELLSKIKLASAKYIKEHADTLKI